MTSPTSVLPVLTGIAFGARTLAERAAGPAPARRPPAAAIERAAEAWARAFAAGDREALARRLAWDGLELAETLARVAAEPDPAAEAELPGWLRRVEGLGVLGRDLGTGSARPELAGAPFGELWRPWCSAALRRLDDATRGGLRPPPAALSGLAEGVGRELARISERAAWEMFAAEGAGRPGAYRRFVEWQLAAGLLPLYGAFPVLLRQTAALLAGFEDSLLELLERLARDGDLLEASFGTVLARWSGLERLASDRHAGGRGVYRLDFDAGPSLVYKPRGVEPEATYAELVGWLRQDGLGDAPPAARVVAHAGYGWMEAVEPSDPAPGEETERWYRRAGALVALADLLGAEDLHAENLIATREGPVAVDLEMLFAPARSPSDLKRGGALGSGLLAAERPREASDRVARWAGLEPVDAARRLGTGRAWEDPGGDGVRPVAVEVAPPPLANAPRHAGRALHPADFAPALLAGYEAAYRHLLSARAAILAADGPLAGVERARTRVLVRSSQDYASLLDRLTDARSQRDGRATGHLLEASLRVFAASAERPLLWPLAAEERAALTGLDVPRFDLPAGATAIPLADGGEVEGAFLAAGTQRLRRRFERWNEADLRAQRTALQAALTETEEPLGLAAAWRGAGARRERFLAVALELGRALARRGEAAAARESEAAGELDERVRAASLYDGSAGRALLLTALARGAGSAPLGAAASDERARFLARLEALASERAAPVGGFQGVGSWIWTLVWLDRLAGDPVALERARGLAASLDDERLAGDARLDVEGGAAGALLGLLALHEATGDAGALERSRAAGEHLLARAEAAPGGLAWRGEIGRLLAGFAHGASGIARALGALASATGEARFADAAAAALGFERGLFDERRGNWPVVLASGRLGEPRATWMTAWCHGAAGVGLARLLLAEALTGPALARDLATELETALATTAGAGARGDDHLCCGGAGRAAILLLAAERRARDDWRSAALALGTELVERAAAAGDFRLPRAAGPASASPWGLMRGRAGIAWLAAGLAGLELPGLLALELPSEAAARRREGR